MNFNDRLKKQTSFETDALFQKFLQYVFIFSALFCIINKKSGFFLIAH